MADFIQGSDLSFVLSGGSANTDPNASLGGNPSSTPIVGTLNNLFDDVSGTDPETGLIDYRCFYIFNDSATFSLFSPEAFIDSEVIGGATVEVGVDERTDLQKIIVSATPGPASGGDATMSYEGDSFIWAFDSDAAVWGANLQTAINGLDSLSGVQVSIGVDSGPPAVLTTFSLSFLGDDNNRNHQEIQLVANNITGGGVVTIEVSKSEEGSPINSIAPIIAVDTVPPVGVSFSTPSVSTPITFGRLGPGDGVPIWIKRITPSDSEPFKSDGFTFRINGKPF